MNHRKPSKQVIVQGFPEKPWTDEQLDRDTFPRLVTTWPTFVELASEQNTKTGLDKRNRSSLNNGPDFTGTQSFEQAVQLANYGWPDGREKVQALLGQINLKGIRRPQPEQITAPAGSNVHIGNYIVGAPDQMRRITYNPTGRRTIQILFNLSTSGSVSRDTMIARGTACIALMIALSKAGISTDLWLCEGIAGNDGKQWIAYIQLKTATQNIDIDRMTYAVAHPSTLRRLLFSYEENQSALFRQTFNIPGGYGTPATPTDHFIVPDVYFPKALGTDPRWQTPTATANWIKSTLADLGYTQEIGATTI